MLCHGQIKFLSRYKKKSEIGTIVYQQIDWYRLFIPIYYLPDFHIPWSSVVTL
jgi:hypothetical protein